MKKIIYSSLVLSAFLLSVGPVFALTPGVTAGNPSGKMQPQTLRQDKAKTSEALLTRAQRELERRIAALRKVSDRVSGSNKISEAQKTALVNDIAAQITSLTSLQEQIKTDTSPTALKSVVSSMIKDYRIFALYLPKVNIIAMSDRILNTTDKLTSVLAILQVKISEAREKGQDVNEAEKLLEEARKQTANASTAAQSAINTVTPLTPEGFPGNKKILINTRVSLMKAHQDLISARQNVQEIRKILKGERKEARKQNLMEKKVNSLTPTVSTAVTSVPLQP